MGSSKSSEQLFDPIRGIAVAATPEELVRQRWLRLMLEQLGYPRGLLAVERDIGATRRADLIVYEKTQEGLAPLMLVEFKGGALRSVHFRQVIGYNHILGAPFVALANAQEFLLGFVGGGGKYQFTPGLPSYFDLVKLEVSHFKNDTFSISKCDKCRLHSALIKDLYGGAKF
ncbi:MAG: type I restriction enzyme HsdR N-terminal domain-containing protein [Verrucomicrobia bacterium]|nr:type I restriction enzyme HsdR N-terminal domain-containing protein [Verrucomicrobiota bacterium]